MEPRMPTERSGMGMSVIYFPSCKFTAKYPQISQKIKNYLKDRHSAEIAGCCKPSLNKITDRDTVVYVCNTCAAFFNESTRAAKVISLWELLLEDTDFQYPHYTDKTLTVQDCWRVYDNRAQQEAVRQILRGMNVEVVELKENFEKTRFCGYSLYEPLPAHYGELAPKRLSADAEAGGFFRTRSQLEKEILMKRHCGEVTTPEVVCCCVACVNGIALGGKNGVHLAEMVFVN